MPPDAKRDGPYWYDERAADSAVSFFGRFLRFTSGEWAGRPFKLEPWQEHDIIRPLFGWKRPDGTRRYRVCYVWIPRKNGKGLALDTPLPTPGGWTTMGDLKVGDQLFDETGAPCRVTFATEPARGLPCYRVTFSDGTSFVTDNVHRWLAKPKEGKPRVVTTEEIARSLNVGRRKTPAARNWTLPLAAALKLPAVDLPIPPYALGVWLGDGNSRHAGVYLGAQKSEVIERLAAEGVGVRQIPSTATDPAPGYTLTMPRRKVGSELRLLGVYGAKHIPEAYLRADEAARWALLRGIVDTDGHVTARGTQIEVVTVRERLAADLVELCRSLGIKATVNQDRAKIAGVDKGPKYRVFFNVYSDSPLNPRRAHAERLRQRPDRPQRSSNLKIVAVEPVDSVTTRCIQVDSPSHLFLAGRGFTPTHNTEIAAGVALLMQLGDGELGGQVFSIAADKDQARLVFEKATAMVQWSPELAPLLECLKTAIYCSQLNSSFKPLSGTPEGKHGLNMSGLIGDEIHEWLDDRLYTFVHQSSASRRQPLEFLISTFGTKDGYGYQAWRYCEQVLDGTIQDPETLVVAYRADPEDDWTDPATWAKANPNLGVSVKLDYLRAECDKAKQLPHLENAFKQYHLNIWTEQAVRWLPMTLWDACTGPADWRGLEARLKGRRCFSGSDLSQTRDLTCTALVFPPEGDDPRWSVLPRFFVPRASIAERVRRDRVPYDRWEADGALIATEGNVVDYDFVRAQYERDAEAFQIVKGGFDPWNAMQLMLQLQGNGHAVEQVRQGYLTLSGPSKELERLLLAGQLAHGGHPVLRWCAGNVAVERDAAGNIKPSKAKSTERIDGIAAMVTALALAINPGEVQHVFTASDLIVI